MVKYSIVYPTRHKPKFIEMALYFISKQKVSDFEVVVSDNYINPDFSCEFICKKALTMYDYKLHYVTPKEDLNMVDNWNFAYTHTTGEYIIYLSDKMFLLPTTLEMIENCNEESPEIINWLKAPYYPENYPEYFGVGDYVRIKPTATYMHYDAKKELIRKYKTPQVFSGRYYVGQLYMGAYKRTLCEKIISHTGALFHPFAPDVTSMLFGLFFAEKAVEFSSPGVVVVANDLSNGNACLKSSKSLASYVNAFALENAEEYSSQALVPGIRHSLFNYVARDYMFCEKSTMCDLNEINWLASIAEELSSRTKEWADSYERNADLSTMNSYIRGKNYFYRVFIGIKILLIIQRKILRNKLLWFARRYLPQCIWNESIVKCENITDVLGKGD